MDNRFNVAPSPSFEIMMYLFSWSMFSDTVPGMMSLALLCLINSILLNNYKYYFKWFFIYAFISYFSYFSHVWTWSWEKRFDFDIPFYDVTVGILIAGEFLLTLDVIDKLRGKELPLISFIKNKLLKVIKGIIQSRIEVSHRESLNKYKKGGHHA